MKCKLPRLLCVIILAMLSGSTVNGASQTVLHKGTGSTPLVIAVVADNYANQNEFLLDAGLFITNGLLADPYYASHQANIEVRTYFEAVAAGSPSKYGFNVEVPSANCVLSWDEVNTGGLVGGLVAGDNPRHTIVIGNHPYDLGCTDGDWTYVALGAVGSDVLMHEMGHGLAALYDEWALASNGNAAYPKTIPANETKNCWDTGNPPPAHWHKISGAGLKPGCDLYQTRVMHAFDSCLMGASHTATFCPVCHQNMQEAFGELKNPDSDNPDAENPDVDNPDAANPDVDNKPKPPTNLRIVKTAFLLQPPPAKGTEKPTPPPPASTPRPILRLLISFDPSTNTIVAKKAFPIVARYTPTYRRIGRYVYEILDGSRMIGVGVLGSNLFEAHNYQGGTRHGTTVKPAEVTLQLPGVTSAWAKEPGHSVSIRMYRLAPTVTETMITPAVFAKLKGTPAVEAVAVLPWDQIRAVM